MACLHGSVVRLHRLVALLRGLVARGVFARVGCAFAQAGGTDFSLQPHSTSQTFAKFLNAEKNGQVSGDLEDLFTE